MTNEEFDAVRQRFDDAEQKVREAMRQFTDAALQVQWLAQHAPPEFADAAAAILARCPIKMTPYGEPHEPAKH